MSIQLILQHMQGDNNNKLIIFSITLKIRSRLNESLAFINMIMDEEFATMIFSISTKID